MAAGSCFYTFKSHDAPVLPLAFSETLLTSNMERFCNKFVHINDAFVREFWDGSLQWE